MTYRVEWTREAMEDMRRLEDFLVEAALERGDLGVVERAMDQIRQQVRILASNPYTCRRSFEDSDYRELVVPFGRSGYVVLFKVVSADLVVVSAARHPREDDFH